MTRTPIFEPPFAPFNAYKSFDLSIPDGGKRSFGGQPVLNISSGFARSAPLEIVASPSVDVEPVSEILRRLELASAEMHNFRITARNARSLDGKLELLEKTFEGSGADLAHAVKGYNSTVSVPTNPPKIRDRPKFNTTGYIDDFTSQDILDLIVFYNNNLGIVYEDDERIRREKLLAFLTRHQSSTCAG